MISCCVAVGVLAIGRSEYRRAHGTLKVGLRMKLRLISGWLPRWLPLLGALFVIGIAFDLVTRSRLSATTGLLCEGEYADTLQVQSMRTRDFEQGPRSQYSYLVRSSAKYECPFFGPDGKL